MINKYVHYLIGRYKFKLFLIFLMAFVAFAKTAECQKSDDSSNENSSKIHFDNGVAFKGEKAMFVDFEKLDYPELDLSEEDVNKSKDDVLKDSIIVYSDDGILHVCDSKKSDRHAQIIETEKLFTYKIKGEKTYIYNKADEQSLLKVLFVKNLTAPKKADGPYFPCMILYLECRWFRGDYEVNCG